jgi:hypothetical protein
MSTADENPDKALDSVMVPEEDALPNPTRTGHGKMPEEIDDDDYQKAVEQERVAAGLADYAPADVPSATDPVPPEASDAADLAQRGLLEEEEDKE